MENLQKEHVLLVKKLSNNKTIKRIQILKKLLSDSEFLVYFKKRLKKYKQVKESNQVDHLIKKILRSKSSLEIAEILCQENNQMFKNLQGVLIHSYLQFRDGVDLTEINPRDFLETKKEIKNRLIKRIKISKYRIGLFIWGSYVMRLPKFSIFSDLDLVLVIDDKELFKKNNFNEFLTNLFNGVKHYNLPRVDELVWVKNNNGVARCGFIHKGVFVNFKILTKAALASCLQIFKESLKQKSRGHLIPGFNNEKLCFDKKEQIPVYPIIEENEYYVIGRGLIAEIFHTGKLIACSDKNFFKELNLLQLKAMARGIKISSFYKQNSDNSDDYLLGLSHTPKNEFNKNYTKKLKRSYIRALTMYGKEKPYILQYLYSEIVLPLLNECPEKYWTGKTLVAFFTGSPINTGNIKLKVRNEAFRNYFKRLNKLKKELKSQNILENSDILKKSIEQKQIKPLIDEITKNLGRNSTVLLFTSFVDLIEKFIVNRRNYYVIVESLFRYIFPNEYKKADITLINIIKKLNKGKDIGILKRELETRLLRKGSVYKLTYRIRKPEGLFHHHLMKRQPMNKIDDIISFQIYYKEKSLFKKVCYLTEKALFEITKVDFQKKMFEIEEYKGCHFYFLNKSIPFEIMVRDINGNTSIKHKIEHSINQKIEQRLTVH